MIPLICMGRKPLGVGVVERVDARGRSWASGAHLAEGDFLVSLRQFLVVSSLERLWWGIRDGEQIQGLGLGWSGRARCHKLSLCGHVGCRQDGDTSNTLHRRQ
jgi:hypothetical protein